MRRPDPRSRSFGSVAERYERYRPGYPHEVVDAVLSYAGRPLRTAVEVGAGTGKATRVFASRGIAVSALEPDADMARVLTGTTGAVPVLSTFEAYTAHAPVDLVYAAAAWHWTDPATRWTRAARLLVPGGVLALFGVPGALADPDLRAAMQEVEREVLPDDGVGCYRWSLEEAAGVDGLADLTRTDLPGAAMMATADYLGRLGTLSSYIVIDAEVRAALLRRVREVLPEHVEIDTTVHLSLARRA